MITGNNHDFGIDIDIEELLKCSHLQTLIGMHLEAADLRQKIKMLSTAKKAFVQASDNVRYRVGAQITLV